MALQAYGIAEFKTGKKMTTDSLFCTCSTTKAFTATALSLAIDESQKAGGSLNWDTPIASLLGDEFVLADDYATLNTTLEDALSHRSGLPGHAYAMLLASPNEALQTEVQKLRYLPLAYAPRTTFDYCNHMYMVISRVLEKITGEDLGKVLKRRFWKPLGMDDTYFSVREVLDCPKTRSQLVQGYSWLPGTKEYAIEPYTIEYAPTTGTGAIVSNVLDYSKWLRALIYEEGPVSSDNYGELFRPRTIISSRDNIIAPPGIHLYALGWFVDNYRGYQLFWHSGSWVGFGIMVGFVPSIEFGFVMMANTQEARNAELELYLYLIDKVLGFSGAGRAEHVARMIQRMQLESVKQESTGEAMKRLFPCLPEPPIPHAVPLDRYIATYEHGGYGSMILELKDGRLHADLMDRVCKACIKFEHASGEFFVGEPYIPGRNGARAEFFRVEFYIDSTGTPQMMGVELEPALRGEKIWFQRRPKSRFIPKTVENHSC